MLSLPGEKWIASVVSLPPDGKIVHVRGATSIAEIFIDAFRKDGTWFTKKNEKIEFPISHWRED